MTAQWYCWQQEALIVQIRLQPRARGDEVIGPHGNRLKIRITAPPVEGKANTQLLRFLVKTFQVSRNQVYLLSGTASRDKRVRIEKPAKLLPGITPPIRKIVS
ncbi:DUF167 domain-containing protein [Nitrosococcus watsonii]|uniref:UPF0235 protein Nwat_3056 n=1 Tax=Nitrosococcus watsoni (strain C-113) TaxID=105559 RepID=D8KCA6_NITWC|nr:DUF167 domain-containing protein [Nitrosococcus watsonii]ADJ29777.1 protein of unknown function DUF167 [Nitrosococcus watsonii C-113]